MQTTTDPLGKLLEDIERRIGEARREMEYAKTWGARNCEAVQFGKIAALVKLLDDYGRTTDEAAERGETFDGGSLQRVGRLCARWREDATAMLEMAEDAPTDSQEQLECYERMRTLRDCADDLEREWAGTEPTDRTQRPPASGSREAEQPSPGGSLE